MPRTRCEPCGLTRDDWSPVEVVPTLKSLKLPLIPLASVEVVKRNSWFRFVAPTSCMNSGVMI